jgi:uncharacterized repeat protein (TIGR01451 family)
MKKLALLIFLNSVISMIALGIGTNDVSITRMNDLLLFTDHNGSCSPTNAGMHAAYVAYKICNTTSPAVTLTNLQVNLGSFTNSQFGLAGGQNANQFIGSLAPGECDVLYWYIFYPCVYNPAQTTNLTVTVSNPPASGTKTLTETYTTWRCQSTLAGGDVVSATVSGGTIIGSIVTMSVTYQFGQASVGDAYWLQPAGNITPYYATTFNAGCYQLLNCKITASTVTGIPLGTQDQLYFTEITPHGGGQTYNVTVEYYFEAHCATSTVAVPYAAQHSGNQDKYTGNYGVNIVTTPTPTASFTLSKTASPTTVVPGNPVTYTVTITNTSSVKVIIDTIVDQLPAPFTFNATNNSGYVKTTNSNTSPASGQTGTLRWIGGDLVPGDFPYTYYVLPANGSINLIYTANVPLGTSTGTYINDAYFIIGQYKSSHVQAPVKVGGDLSITKTDGKTYYGTGNNTYTIVVSNSGPGDITGATVTDTKPAMATSMSWTVTGTTGGATVANSSGSGSISELVNMPAGSTITYSVTLVIPCGATGTLTNTATVAPPTNVPDPNMANNSATDNDFETVWTGNVDSNWDNDANWTQGEPNCGKNAIIPDVSPKPNPLINSTGNFTADLVIQQGAQLTVNPGMELKACGCTQINQHDGLYLKSDASGNAKFIDNGTISYANNGSAKVELYLTNCIGFTNKFRCWHYITPPVYDAMAGVFNGDYMKSYIEPSGAWSPYYTHSGTLLNELQGYAVSANGSGVRTFDGQLITGTQTTNPLLTRTVNLGWGWNLVGNPYASPVDLNSANITWTNVDAQAYYLDQAAGNYKVWPASNPYGYGTGTQYPLSMQGFFVHVKEGQFTGSITWTNAARTFTSDHIFYKNSTDDLFYLKAEENSGLNDEIIICFNPESSPNLDNNLDCSKLDGDPEAPQLWTLSADENRLTVNTLPFSGKQTTIPIGFSVEQPTDGTKYTLTASNIESFRTGMTITLEDKKLQTTQDLTVNPAYNFTYAAGDDPSRFLLHFFNPFYGLNDQEKDDDMLIFSYGHDIYLKDLTGQAEKGDLFLYNLMGQEIAKAKVSDISLNKYNFNTAGGYYLVRVITKDKAYTGKVYLE